MIFFCHVCNAGERPPVRRRKGQLWVSSDSHYPSSTQHYLIVELRYTIHSNSHVLRIATAPSKIHPQISRITTRPRRCFLANQTVDVISFPQPCGVKPCEASFKAFVAISDVPKSSGGESLGVVISERRMGRSAISEMAYIWLVKTFDRYCTLVYRWDCKKCNRHLYQ